MDVRLAETFAANGACVAANDISPVNLDPLAAEHNGRIKAYVEDVAKKSARKLSSNRRKMILERSTF